MHTSASGLTRNDLIGICLDFFEAGGETVGSTLSWLFMYMALNPEVQDKCYEELAAKLGESKSMIYIIFFLFSMMIIFRWAKPYP